MDPVDLRSDTVTQPGEAMRRAIAGAEVGDDVLVEDPTVKKLEFRVATLLGKAAALYVPSGTMSNQLAIRAQTEPGQQLICHVDAHIHRYELGAAAALSGLQVNCVHTPDGSMPWSLIEEELNTDDIHCAPPAIVCFENTHNRCGGRVLDLSAFRENSDRAHDRGLGVHLDGARLWNAAVATGESLAALAAPADTVSVCFSKGMGAPVGSVLVGSVGIIQRARRFRKQWGGGMRQVGFLAEACLFALDNHIERLADDHARARRLGASIEHPELRLASEPETNIVLFDVIGSRTSDEITQDFARRGVLTSTFGPRRVRMVTHLDVGDANCDRAIEVINSTACSGTTLGEER